MDDDQTIVLSNALSRLAKIAEDKQRRIVVESILTQRLREETDRKEWALVSKHPDSRTGKRRVLKWFGTEKPTEEEVAKEERRVQYFKHKG